MRISINPTHDQYLQTIASQMSTTPAEALNYLIWELRRQNFSFGSPLSQPLPTTQFKSPSAIAQFVAEASTEDLPTEIDPIIAKLAGLIEDF